MASSGTSSRGQATVEVVALIPLIAGLALGLLQLLAAGVASELADHAAEAGAVAVLERSDPRAAIEAAVPHWSRSRLRSRVVNGSIRVELEPRALAPAIGRALRAEAEVRLPGESG